MSSDWELLLKKLLLTWIISAFSVQHLPSSIFHGKLREFYLNNFNLVDFHFRISMATFSSTPSQAKSPSKSLKSSTRSWLTLWAKLTFRSFSSETKQICTKNAPSHMKTARGWQIPGRRLSLRLRRSKTNQSTTFSSSYCSTLKRIITAVIHSRKATAQYLKAFDDILKQFSQSASHRID